MNRIYKTLWSVSTQSWQAVPETAKSSGKKSSSSAVGVVASVALSLSLSGGANAQSPPAINQLPTGGTVARGTATISQTATAQAAAMTVNQSSQRAVINWNTFNLGQSASINFVQPNAQAVTLNRVNDSNPSQIFGRMTANGQVFLSNANGVYFSPTSSVDVGALTATTNSISDDNFMSGKYVFERNGAAGKVTNNGNITTALGGYVALLAPEVQNSGVVVARAGTVALAAGEMITLTIDGTGSLAGITTTPSTIATLVENKHAVLAPDGQIILSAVALDKLQSGVIKNSGNLEANSISNKGGKIYLEGDDIILSSTSKLEAKGATGGGTALVGGDWQGSGTLRQATKVTMEAGATIDASATVQGDGGKVVLWSDVHNADSATRVSGSIKAEAGPNGGDGGKVETSGNELKVDDIQVSTKAPQGATGEWLLDPNDFTIGTTMTGSALGTLLLSNDITIKAGTGTNGTPANTYYGTTGTSGNVIINNNVSWSTNTLTLISAGTGGIYGYGGLAIGAGGKVIFDFAGTAPMSYSGLISGDGAVTYRGAGRMYISGANTYTGGTTIEGTATVVANNPTALGQNAITVNAGSTLSTQTIMTSTGTLTLNGTGVGGTGALKGDTSFSQPVGFAGPIVLASDSTISSPGTKAFNLTSATPITGAYKLTLSANSAGNTIDSPIATGSLSRDGAFGTWILNGTNTYTGPTDVLTGNLIIGGAGSLGGGTYAGNITISSASGSAFFKYSSSTNQTLSGNITDYGSFVKDTSTTSKVTLSGNNTANFTLNAGVLRAESDNALGSVFSALTVASGATLELAGPAGPGGLTSTKKITVANGGTIHNVSGYNTYSGTLALSGDATITVDTGTRLNFSATTPDITVAANKTLTFNTANGDLTFGQKLLTNTGASFTQSGSGTLTMAAGSTLAKGIFAGLYDPTGTDYSSVYGSTPDLTFAFFDAASGGTRLNLVSGTDYTGSATWNSTLTSSTAAGTYALTYASGLAKSGYVVLPTAATNWIVTKAPLTVTANNASKTYNGSQYSGGNGVSYSGFVNNETNSVLGGALTYSGNSQGALNVGSYAITPSGLASSNYSFNYVNGTLTVNPIPIVISGGLIGTVSKTYDGTNAATLSSSNYQLTGWSGSDGATITKTSGTYSTTSKGTGLTVTVNLTNSDYTASGSTNFTNYTLPTVISGSVGTITAKALTVTAPVVSKVYDGTTSATGAATVDALGSGDVVNAAATLAFTDKNVGAANKTVQASGLTIKDASNADMTGNYVITYADNTASTITAKALTVSGTSVANKTYDGTPTATLSNGTLVGVVGSENVTLTQVGTFVSANVGTGISVTAADTLGGADAGNYTLTQPTGLTADILAAASTNVPPAIPPIILPPAPVTPPSVPPGTNPISKEVLPAPPVAEVDSNEPQTTNERTNNKNANSAVLAAAASVAQAVNARPQTVGIPTSAPTGSQASVQVLLVKPPSVQTEGLLNVRVSAELVSSANNLVIPLADHLDWRQLQANDAVSVRLANGMSLPDWVQYEAPQKALVAKAIPLNALPLQVMVQIGDRRYLVDIREADLNKVGMQ